MKSRKARWILASLGAAILLLAAAFFAVRLRGSVKVTSEKTAVSEGKEVICLYQKDAHWKDDKLGNSGYTMETSGCLTTCLSAVLQMQGVQVQESESLMPKALNRYFSEQNVYDSEGNIQWEPLERAIGKPIVRKAARELSEGELEQLLENGIYPIVRVRVGGIGSFHYVVLTGCSESGSFQCMDPLNETGETVSLSQFLNRIYAVRYVEN